MVAVLVAINLWMKKNFNEVSFNKVFFEVREGIFIVSDDINSMTTFIGR